MVSKLRDSVSTEKDLNALAWIGRLASIPNRTPSPTLLAPKPAEAGVIFLFVIRLFNSFPAVAASRSTTTFTARLFFDSKAVPCAATVMETLNVSTPDDSPLPNSTSPGRLPGLGTYIL